MFRTADKRVQRRTRFSQALVVGILAAMSAGAQSAEPISPKTTASAMDTGVDLVKERMEEIVVYATRGKRDSSHDELLTDPLRTRILEEIRVLNILDEEFEWRMETAKLEMTPPRIRVGYDPRNDGRTSPLLMTHVLPLDLMQPATVFAVDFEL